MARIRAIDFVYAKWCPHSTAIIGLMRKAATELGVPFRLYNIDTRSVNKADQLVKRYGDWSPDYTIPQVFVEFTDGEVKHALTGRPQSVAQTTQAGVELFRRLMVYRPNR